MENSKPYWLIALVLLLLVGGMVFFYKSRPPAEMPGVTAVVLPANSWYNSSLWSYVSGSPSVRQILRQNEEANGKTPSLETARTLSFSGKMSSAVGTCFEQTCIDQAKSRMIEQQRHTAQQFRLPNAGTTYVEEINRPENSDKYDNLGFSELGKLELLVKLPDMMLKRATAINRSDDSHRRIEVSEFFNGMEGRRITDYFDALDNKVKSEVALMDAQQVETARLEQTSLLGKDFDHYKDMEFRGLEKVNDRVAFTVTATNPKGEPEKFFFDAVTGFVIKLDTPLNSVYFDNYRPWGEGKLPYTVYLRQSEPGGFYSWIKIEIGEWKIGDAIDDSVFEIPAGTS
jgi:hypothetical protein